MILERKSPRRAPYECIRSRRCLDVLDRREIRGRSRPVAEARDVDVLERIDRDECGGVLGVPRRGAVVMDVPNLRARGVVPQGEIVVGAAAGHVDVARTADRERGRLVVDSRRAESANPLLVSVDVVFHGRVVENARAGHVHVSGCVDPDIGGHVGGEADGRIVEAIPLEVAGEIVLDRQVVVDGSVSGAVPRDDDVAEAVEGDRHRLVPILSDPVEEAHPLLVPCGVVLDRHVIVERGSHALGRSPRQVNVSGLVERDSRRLVPVVPGTVVPRNPEHIAIRVVFDREAVEIEPDAGVIAPAGDVDVAGVVHHDRERLIPGAHGTVVSLRPLLAARRIVLDRDVILPLIERARPLARPGRIDVAGIVDRDRHPDVVQVERTVVRAKPHQLPGRVVLDRREIEPIRARAALSGDVDVARAVDRDRVCPVVGASRASIADRPSLADLGECR
jgi:hypothetical protein